MRPNFPTKKLGKLAFWNPYCVPPSSRRKAYIVHLQVRTYSPPKVVIQYKRADTEINPYQLYDCPLAPEAKFSVFLR